VHLSSLSNVPFESDDQAECLRPRDILAVEEGPPRGPVDRGGLALFVQNPEPATKQKIGMPVSSLAAEPLPPYTRNYRTNPIPQTNTPLAANSRLGFNSAGSARAGLTAWLSSTTRWGYEYRCDGTAAASLVQRYYASTYGRFLSPDQYRASGGPTDPQSWNRYVYTRGDPINRKDLLGLCDQSADTDYSVTVCGDNSSLGGVGSAGVPQLVNRPPAARCSGPVEAEGPTKFASR
jgi:RHS repeat-associated protein